MAYTLWSQDVFSRGEISPLLYSRISVNAYYNGLKTAKNILSLPQGAAAKRFGTDLWSEVSGIIEPQNVLFESFQYLDQCVYLVLFKDNNVSIYLEGILVYEASNAIKILSSGATVTTLNESIIKDLDFTVIQDKFRISGPNPVVPADLTRSLSETLLIASVAADVFTFAATVDSGKILPVLFTTAGTLPLTVPPIRVKKIYFLKALTATTGQIYPTAVDAKAGTNLISLTNVGAGANNILVQNKWDLWTVIFGVLPVFDYDANYNAITFTPAAVIGTAVILTASAPIFTAAHAGGIFVGNSGTARILTYTDTTHVVIAISTKFTDLSAIPGNLSFLAEPAWSDARGWPKKCSSYQNRAFFCNTDLLPNGVWGSVINAYCNFDGLDGNDDDAISWFPSSDTVNVINYIVPYRSFTVHTNSGVYSTPLSSSTAITPSNFSLALQDSTPADKIQPRTVDNQIIIISGNDAHSLVWDGINNAYTSSIISAVNEQVLTGPVDEAPFVDLTRAGSRYVFVVNLDGSLAMYQTLLSEEVSGWTRAVLEQSYGTAKFIKVTSNFDGRAWFLNERQIATADAAVNITAYEITAGLDGTIFTSTGSNFSTTAGTATKLATTGALPVTTPQVNATDYYWIKAIDANTYKLYITKEDAVADLEPITIQAVGTNSQVVAWSLKTKDYIEELNRDTRVDMALQYDGALTSTLTGASPFNAQSVKINGDGYGFDAIGNNDEIAIKAHGVATAVQVAQAGFAINVQIDPLPLSIATGQNTQTTNLAKPKHIRNATFNFNETVGGEINGVPIKIQKFSQVGFGVAPIPATGLFEFSIMKAWSDFENPAFSITHSEPFDMRLTGIFYAIEV